MTDVEKLRVEWDRMREKGYTPCEAWPYDMFGKAKAEAEFGNNGEYKVIFDENGFRVYRRNEDEEVNRQTVGNCGGHPGREDIRLRDDY